MTSLSLLAGRTVLYFTYIYFSCWMNLIAFYYAFAIPISCIIATNVVIFIITIVSIFRRGKGLRSNQKKQKMAMTNLQAAITSFILLGKDHLRIQRGGGTGGPDLPEKSQKYRVFLQYRSGSPEKSQLSNQASIQCWAIIDTPAKRH